MKSEGEQHLLHELRAPIEDILSYGRLIAAESGDSAVREYAEKIEAAAAGIADIIDRLPEKGEDCGGEGASRPTAGAAVRPVPAAESSAGDKTPLVLIVDDDITIRKTAELILGRVYRTATAESGADALAKIAAEPPALILMDIMMPGMDGFETLARIRSMAYVPLIPVIFLTGDESRDTEVRCLKAGASDFVRKPLVAQVLVERVRRLIELDRLQNALSTEVAVQTKRSAHLSQQIMLALSKAVDAKDHYTNGHSQRVASYSVEIARRMGKSKREQEEIYAMGLLHDVGKIGVSEAIINKTSRLDNDEYAQIKTHTTIGYDILKIITEIPGLATGARWHHERYDGKGYPDGLAGTDIPEEARIICVADSYDAMTSNRSYSKIREQAAVREEMLRCRGSQFDPEIADIMVAMIDDDPDYRMSERAGHAAAVPMRPRDVAAAQIVDDELPGNAADAVLETAKKEKPFIPEVSGLDAEFARNNLGDDEILAASLRSFCELMPAKLNKLRETFATADSGGDISPYRIEVHSMKSASASVGLTTLSEVARALEMMAKEGDIAGIRALNDPFILEWEQTHERLAAAYREHDGGAADDILPDGTKVLPELLELMTAHLENMDIDAADDVMKLIKQYSYSERVQPLIDELGTAVLGLDEDGAAEAAEKIKRELGQ